jgi:hypothetical protein
MSFDYLERNANLFNSFEMIDGDALYWQGPLVTESKKWELVVPSKQQRIQFSSLSRLQAAWAKDEPFWTQKVVYNVTSGRVSKKIYNQLAGRAIRKCPDMNNEEPKKV